MQQVKGFRESLELGTEEGWTAEIDDISLVYHENIHSSGSTGYFYSLETTGTDFKVLNRDGSVSREMYVSAGRWKEVGLRKYLETIEKSSFMEKGDNQYPPEPRFNPEEIRDEIQHLVNTFLEE